MVKRIVTGAHYGLKDWLAQRITAVVMAVYIVGFAVMLAVCPPQHYGDWRALFQNQFMRVATFAFFVSLFWHAWIGVRDIFMDYLQPTALRLALECLAILVLVAYTGWAIQILWSV
jgi:succinate dehydrogenase / fumarate reductase membrane anchor subunit